MKLVLIFAFFSFAFLKINAQKIVLTELIEVENKNNEEALYYYNNNWLLFRKAMLKKGYILSYKIMQVIPDSLQTNMQLILETIYKDSLQEAMAEPRWQSIIKVVNGGTIKFLNTKRQKEFRKTLYSKKSKIIADSKSS